MTTSHRPKDTYKILMRCLNCLKTQVVEIKKGSRIRDEYTNHGNGGPCEYCGCDTLHLSSTNPFTG